MICVICERAPVSHKYLIDRFDPAFAVSECPQCGCLMRDPMPQNPDLYYDAGYYEGGSQFHYQDERKTEKAANFVFLSRLKTIRKYINSGKFLDVGCAFGAFARAASKYYEAAGIDVSAWVVKQAETHFAHSESYKGVFHGSLLRLPSTPFFKPKSFNVITLIEVAEHLQMPRENFKAAYQLLTTNGLLLIQTANFEGLQAESEGKNYHYFLPGHLVYYRATALKKMLSEIGFGKFQEFFPVDFSLWAKIRKSVAQYTRLSDYKKLWKMIKYHFASRKFSEGRPMTSSYVLYAYKL